MSHSVRGGRGAMLDVEGPLARWSRRAVTLPGFFLALLVVAALLPALLPLLALIDAARRGRFMGVRFLLFLVVYLGAEIVGVVLAFLVWVPSRWSGPERLLARSFRLQCWWAGVLFGAARRLFDLRLVVEGADVCAGPGPVLLFIRHVSVGDTVLPAVIVSAQKGRRLRYVLKRELLWDPCLDVVGQRLPNIFVRRGTHQEGGSSSELSKVEALCHALGPDEGVVIFPEGTRFTPKKREQLIARLVEQNAELPGEETGEEPQRTRLLRAATELAHVLPPRLGGALTLLSRAPEADVVFCAHTGLEGISTLGDLWRGSLLGRTLAVRFWRVARPDIPTSDDERTEWLLAEWARVDAFATARALLTG